MYAINNNSFKVSKLASCARFNDKKRVVVEFCDFVRGLIGCVCWQLEEGHYIASQEVW